MNNITETIKLTNDNSKLPRVLAINDLSGFSHTSLMAIIPILNTLGISVCALPTAVLSSNTEQSGYQLIDCSFGLDGFLLHWEKLKLRFSAIYSGFLGSDLQVELVEKAINMFSDKETLIIIDPVMGDDGKLYDCFGTGIVKSMQRLITKADIITPNLTEASLLLGMPSDLLPNTNKIKAMCKALAESGPDYVVITSVPVMNDRTKTAVVCFNKALNRFNATTCKYLPVNYPGTGDIFTGVLTGLLLKGYDLSKAIRQTVTFVSKAIELTIAQKTPSQEGICLERTLSLLRRL